VSNSRILVTVPDDVHKYRRRFPFVIHDGTTTHQSVVGGLYIISGDFYVENRPRTSARRKIRARQLPAGTPRGPVPSGFPKISSSPPDEFIYLFRHYRSGAILVCNANIDDRRVCTQQQCTNDAANKRRTCVTDDPDDGGEGGRGALILFRKFGSTIHGYCCVRVSRRFSLTHFSSFVHKAKQTSSAINIARDLRSNPRTTAYSTLSLLHNSAART